jgi:hypothetical protein
MNPSASAHSLRPARGGGRTHVRLRDSALVVRQLRDFPAAAHLLQAAGFALAQLGGADNAQRVTNRVQAANLLGKLDRLLAP